MDPFKILGLSSSASQEEIKAAFRKKAQTCHPDKFAGASEGERKNAELAFKALSEAYKRALKPPERGNPKHPAPPRPTYHSSYNYGPFTKRTYQRPKSRWLYPQLYATIILGTAAAGALLLLESSVYEALWSIHNKGKLFKDIK